MKRDESKYDETESIGGPMIRLTFSEWILAPRFAYLKDAPMAECETCDTISAEGAALERRNISGQGVKRFINTTFATFGDFKKSAAHVKLVFFHIFEGRPSKAVLKLLSACEDIHTALLLDVGNDLGFLRNTLMSVNGNGKTVAKTWSEFRGLGAWANGEVFGFEENEAEMASFVAKARAFSQARRP